MPSKSLRTAHNVSSGVASPPAMPSSCAIRSPIRSTWSSAAIRVEMRRRASSGSSVPTDPDRLLHRLHDRQEGDAVAVGEAAPAEHPRAIPDPGHEGLQEPRLPDPADPQHGEQLARLIGHRAIEGTQQERELALAPDHGSVEPPGEPDGDRIHLQDPIRRQGLALALQRERLQRVGQDRVTHEAIGGLADQDLARPGSLLEPRRDVHGIAGAELGRRTRLGDHDLPGVQPDTDLDLDAVCVPEFPVERGERSLHVGGGPNRPEGIVLADLRHAEHRQHGVTDELLDRAAVALDHGPHGVEVAGQHDPERLGVEPFAERCRAHDVAEQDRHGAASLSRRLVADPRAAARAEREVVDAFPPTAPAGLHRSNVSVRGARRSRASAPQPFAGISFFGSRNGIGVTVAVISPSGESIATRVPAAACSIGTHA